MIDETLPIHMLMGCFEFHSVSRNDIAHRWAVRELVRKPEGYWNVIRCVHICYGKEPLNVQQLFLCPVTVRVDLDGRLIKTSMSGQ